MQKEVNFPLAPSSYLDDCCVATVTVGERGQVVIPVDVRKKLHIQTGDKLFIMSHPSGEGMVLFKVNAMREFLNRIAAGLGMVDEPGDARSSG